MPKKLVLILNSSTQQSYLTTYSFSYSNPSNNTTREVSSGAFIDNSKKNYII